MRSELLAAEAAGWRTQGANLPVHRYQPDLQGILLSIARVSLPAAAVTLSVSPFAHMTVKVQGLLYRPVLGSTVPVSIDFVSEGHIGGLLLGVFNVAVPKDLLPAGSSFDEAADEWALGSSGAKVGVGSVLSLRLLDMSVSEGGLSLLATARPAGPTEAAVPAEVEAPKAKVQVGGAKRSREADGAGTPEGVEAGVTTKRSRKEKKSSKKKSNKHSKR